MASECFYKAMESGSTLTNGTQPMEIRMAPMILLTEDDFSTVSQVYCSQIEFGSDKRTALNLATIVYQQRHPYAEVDISRNMIKGEIRRRILH